MKRVLSAGTLLATIIVLASLVNAAAPATAWPHARGWPEYGGSALHTGLSAVVGPAAYKEAAAPVGVEGPSFSAPVADLDANVYVGDHTGVVSKFSSSLKTLWQTTPLSGPIRSSVALGPDGTVYVTPVGDSLIALDGMTGEEKWRYDVNNNAEEGTYVVIAAPTIHPNGFIVQPSMDGNFYAVNFDGSKRWGPVGNAGDKCVAAAAIGADGTIYAGCQNARLYAIKPDGTVKWSLVLQQTAGGSQLQEQQVAAPSIGPTGHIYVTTRVARSVTGSVYAIKDGGASGSIQWRVQLNEKVTAPPAVDAAGNLYIGDLGGDFFKIDSKGAIQWTFSPPEDDPDVYDDAQASDRPLAEVLAVAELAVLDRDGRVYVPYWHVDLTQGFPPQLSFPSPLYALDTDDGSVVWRHIYPKTIRSPALLPSDSEVGGMRQGILYLAGDDGNVYAVGEGKPLTPAVPDPTITSEPDEPTTSGTNPTSTTSQGNTPGLGLLAALAATLGGLLMRKRRA